MTTTNDAMYAKLKALYPNGGNTLGDLLYTYWSSSGATTIATTRTNLVPNPNFEVNASTWNVTGGTPNRITTDSYSGVACLQQTKVAGRTEIILLETIPIPVVGGQTYTVSAYFKVPAGQESMSAGIRILWYDAAGVQIPPTFIDGTYATLTNTDGWQRRTFTGVAPANAASIRSYFGQKDSGTAGQTFLLDAVMVEQASSALPYFDGTYVNDYQGYGLSTKAWNGTANNSSSTASWFVGNTRTNLITNPSFEVDLSGWGSLGTVTRSTAESYVGVASAALVHDTVTAPHLFASVSVVAGLDYTVSFYVKQSVANGGQMFVDFRWYNAAGTMILDDVNYEFSPNASWQRFSQTRTAPAGAVSAQIVPRMPLVQGGPIPTINYMDAFMVEQASSALPYFDGTYAAAYAGYGSYSKTWNGTANASTSTSVWFTGNSRTNLVQNPNFETNVLFTEVSNTGSGIATRSTAESYIGNASCAAYPTPALGFLVVTTPPLTAGRMPITGGQTYTASFYIKSTVSRNAYISLRYYDAAGAELQRNESAASETSTTEWQRRSVSGTAPALAVAASLLMVVQNVPSGEVHYFDARLLEAGSTLLPYFDGTYADNYAGYTITQQGWTGTANNSTSSANWFLGVGSGLANRGALQYDYYVSKGATGSTLGDLANSFWSDPDISVSNLQDELGNDLLLEDGSLMLLEAGNV